MVRERQVGAFGQRSETTLDLGVDTALEITTFGAAFAHPVGSDLTLAVGVGAITDGELRAGAVTATLADGLAVSVSGTRTRVFAGGILDQLDLSLSGSYARATTRHSGTGAAGKYAAVDLRLGLRGVRRLGGGASGWVSGRVFGGPVTWDREGTSDTGGDLHHYQLGFGAAWRTGGLGVYAEAMVAGERALGAGAGWSW
ncbi:hypothetical protein KDM41_02235 [bacterium]|nr:hypothetical protein [bacterium]